MPERNLDFDQVIDRKNTRSLKYDFAKERNMPEDVLPLWVADMDFKTSSYIEDALTERVREGIFGYSEVQTPYFDILKAWMQRRHHWEVQQEWLIKTPGVVFALAMAVRAYTRAGDKVLLQLPVYYPFSQIIQENGRRVVSSDLYLSADHRYHIDFDDLESKIVKNKIRLFFLCNPHNPVGRVWTRGELTRIGELCLKHGVTVVSDEIHHDFIFRGEHTVFASIKKEFEAITITCTSPSKTFNLASMLISNIFIADPGLRQQFARQVDAAGISQLSVLGLVAAEAAYQDGEEWFDAAHAYIRENILFAEDFVRTRLGIDCIPVEGTYLLWLDFRKTGLSDAALDKLLINRAKLWLDSGRIFGKPGEGFQRLNAACPRSVLTTALERIQALEL